LENSGPRSSAIQPIEIGDDSRQISSTIEPIKREQRLNSEPEFSVAPTTLTIQNHLKAFLNNQRADFKYMQQSAVEMVLERSRDLFIRLPTGSGKSLIYQLPAFIEKETGLVTVVFCPLRSLVEDQVKNLNNRFKSMAGKLTPDLLSGYTQPPPLLYLHYNEYFDGSQAFIFIERLIAENKLARIIFDEAQTIVLWDSFTSFKQSLPLIRTTGFPIIFLSGSASPAIIDECIEIFKLPIPHIIFNASPRKNLKYILGGKNRLKIHDIEQEERIIIFVAAIKDIAETKSNLENTMKIDPQRIFSYHGRMTHEEKDRNQGFFNKTSKGIMIATLAFALGIDYSHVRYVFVIGSAYGLDNLIQMFGRAGRDGFNSECVYIPESSYNYASSSKEKKLLVDLESNKQCLRYLDI